DLGHVIDVQQRRAARQLREVEARAVSGDVLAGQIMQVGGVERAEAADLGRGLRLRDVGETEEVHPVGGDLDIGQLQVRQPRPPERNPFSKTAKSAPGPFAIGALKPSVIEPPSPSETMCVLTPFAIPSALLGSPNEARGLFATAMSWGPRVIERTEEAHSRNNGLVF